MELYLGLDDLYDCVLQEPSDQVRQNPSSPEMKRDLRARSKISLMVQPHLLIHVRTAKTAFEAWKNLSEIFEDKGVFRRIGLIDQLLDTKHVNFRSLYDYVMSMRDVIHKVSETGKPMDNEFVAFLMLRNLKPEYKWLRQLIEKSVKKEEELTLDMVSNALIREGQKEAVEEGGESESSKAFLAGGNQRRNFCRRDGGREQSTKRFPSNRPGAALPNEMSTLPKEQHQQKILQSEQSTSHGGQQFSRNRAIADVVCFNCKKVGHKASKCWYKNKGKGSNNNISVNNISGNNNNSNSPWSLLTTMSASCNRETSYIDSGASAHMCGNREWLKNYKIIENKVVNCAGNEKLYTAGLGDIIIDGPNGFKGIENVTHVPNLNSNLLSVSAISKLGLVTVFDDLGCSIYKKCDVSVTTSPLLCAQEAGGIYRLDLNVSQPKAFKVANDVKNDLWHKRLAHLGLKNMHAMSSGLVDGFVMNSSSEGVCDSCV